MSDEMVFIEDKEATASSAVGAQMHPWIVLIVDDDPLVHEVTELVMEGFVFDARPIKFFSTYSAIEAHEFLVNHKDVALILLDVVMETAHAGLDLVRVIREELGNNRVRIVLRTGQAGQAPEEEVIRDYDINDYCQKTELTKRKMSTVFYSALRAYRDIMMLEKSRANLRRSIDAIAEVSDSQSLRALSTTLLEQINVLTGQTGDALCISRVASYMATSDQTRQTLLAATHGFEGLRQGQTINVLPESVRVIVEQVIAKKASYFDKHCFVAYYCTHSGCEIIIYMTTSLNSDPSMRELLDLFSRNVAITYEGLLLRDEIQKTHRASVNILTAALAQRTALIGTYFQRVSDVVELLAKSFGLRSIEVEFFRQAANLHDVGMVCIQDVGFDKPEALSKEERQQMQEHPALGVALLVEPRTLILNIAAIMSLEHHERWDGSGYPHGLRGEEISLPGRISGLADVFNSFVSARPYRAAHSLDAALEYVRLQSGHQFDPHLVSLLLEQESAVREIYASQA